MNPLRPKLPANDGKEAQIQAAIIKELKCHDWYVRVIVGNAFQHGLPDLYIFHRNYGPRWVEVKNPERFSFTDRQIENFPVMGSHGIGIWILFSAEVEELGKLFKPCNWEPIFLNWVHNVHRGTKK